ncbi:hypothetical protein CsSME_00036372 [Camellia sinensis var. sinensis]
MGTVIGFPSRIVDGADEVFIIGDWGQGVCAPAPPWPIAIPTDIHVHRHRCNLFLTSCRGLLKDIQGGRENTVSFTVSTKLPKNQSDSRFFLHMWAKIPGVRGKVDRLFMFIHSMSNEK